MINHSSLTHPHIVKFRECFLTDKYLAIAMVRSLSSFMLLLRKEVCAEAIAHRV